MPISSHWRTSSRQVGKSTHFRKIYISVKTAEFVSWIPKSLILRSEWGNIKEWNKYPQAPSDSKHAPMRWPKKELVLVLFQFPTRSFITSCYLPKCIILTVILFFVHGVAALPRLPDGMTTQQHGNVLLRCQTWHMVLQRCYVWHVTDSLCFVYILPIESPNGILFIKSIFKLK